MKEDTAYEGPTQHDDAEAEREIALKPKYLTQAPNPKPSGQHTYSPDPKPLNGTSRPPSQSQKDRLKIDLTDPDFEFPTFFKSLIEPIRNNPDILWFKYGTPPYIATIHSGVLIRVNAHLARTDIGHVVKTGKWIGSDEKKKWRSKPLPHDQAQALLNCKELVKGLDRINSVVKFPLPYVGQDGKFKPTQTGLDQESGIFTVGGSETPMEAGKAIALIHKLFGGFCFSDQDGTAETNLANIIAAMITPFIPKLYTGQSPAFAVQGNQPGVGKSLLIQTCTIPMLGKHPSYVSHSRDEEENRKRLLSAGMEGGPIYWVDEVKGVFKSQSLNGLITNGTIAERLLKTNTLAHLDWRPVVYFSGNQFTFEDDMARRVVLIHLRYNKSDLDDRKFEISELLAYVDKHKKLIRSAIYGLIANWVDKGMPDGPHEAFQSFDDWARAGCWR